jgi:hypothetical protein
MLSIEQCKEILENRTISDDYVEKIRDALYALVENIIDEYIKSCDKI